MFNKLKNSLFMFGAMGLMFFTQMIVSDAGFTVEAGDVSAIKTPLYTWVGSLFNLAREYAGVIIAVVIFGFLANRFFRR